MSNGRGYFKTIIMKTALQELIEMMNDAKEKGFENLNWLKIISTYNLLEKEKQQIINAHFEGWSDAYDYLKDDFSAPRQAEDYYNETYNNDN